MNAIPNDRRYTASHEWVQPQADGSLRIGITDYAQSQLGDLVFLELPKVGRSVTAGEACAVVESVKTASDVYSPVAGEVVAINGELADSPELTNGDAYGQGWLFQLKPANPEDLAALLDATAYQHQIEVG